MVVAVGQTVEVRSVENIHEVGVEAGRVVQAGRVVEAGRVVNIRLVVYRNAQVIQVTDKISENEVEMIVWVLSPFLNGGCRDFLVVGVDEYRDFAIFLEFLVEEFLELLIEVGMEVVV
jgi:hypothetical protein